MKIKDHKPLINSCGSFVGVSGVKTALRVRSPRSRVESVWEMLMWPNCYVCALGLRERDVLPQGRPQPQLWWLIKMFAQCTDELESHWRAVWENFDFPDHIPASLILKWGHFNYKNYRDFQTFILISGSIYIKTCMYLRIEIWRPHFRDEHVKNCFIYLFSSQKQICFLFLWSVFWNTK